MIRWGIVIVLFLAAIWTYPLYIFWRTIPALIVSPIVPYCVVSFRAQATTPWGGKVLIWTQGYDRCELQDEYREI